MAVDKKSDHVGNHGGAYTDIHGMSRQFTVVDHDRHTSRTKLGRETKETKSEKENRVKALNDQIRSYNEECIDAILAMPAVSLLKSQNLFAEDCIVRDIEKGEIRWDEVYTRNFLTIRADLIPTFQNMVWKHTVKEQFWFDELSNQDIIAGKWKELI